MLHITLDGIIPLRELQFSAEKEEGWNDLQYRKKEKKKSLPRNKSSCCTLHEVSRHSIPWEKHETEPRLGNNDDYPQLNDHDPRLCTLLQFPSNNTPSPSRVYWKFLQPSYFYFHLVSISWAKIKFLKKNLMILIISFVVSRFSIEENNKYISSHNRIYEKCVFLKLSSSKSRKKNFTPNRSFDSILP